MVRIRLPDTTEATLQGRRWSSASDRLERILNAMIAPWGPYHGEGEAEIELQEARVASKVLGASIVDSNRHRGG